MSLVQNILLRPHPFQRATDENENIMHQMIDLITRLMKGGLQEGPLRDMLLESLQEAFQGLVVEIEGRLDTAAASLQTWLEPIITALKAFGSGLDGAESPGQIIKALGQMLHMFINLLESTSSDKIGEKLKSLFRIITVDLGISREGIESIFSNAVDIIAEKLKASYLAGDQTPVAYDQFLIGHRLLTLKQFMRSQNFGAKINIDLDQFATFISAYIKSIKWDDIRARVQEVLQQIAEGADKLDSIADLLSGKFNAAAGVEIGGPGSPMEGEPDLDPVSWYATYFDRSFVDDIPVRVADRFHWDSEPFFPKMSFRDSNLTPRTMEHFAFWSEGVANLVQIILHLRSLERSDISSNLLHTGLRLIDFTTSFLISNSTSPGWVSAYKFFHNNIFDVLSTLAWALATGNEGKHEFKGEGQPIFWITLVGKDATEALLYKNWPARLRQGLLSLLTLINSDRTTKPLSENHKRVEGFAMMFAEIFSWIGATFTGRGDYGIPRGDFGPYLKYWVGGTFMSVAGGVVGWLLGWVVTIIARPSGTPKLDYFPGWSALLWVSLESFVTGLFKYPVYNYLVYNNDTNGGTFYKENTTPPVEQILPGYPTNKASSPYKLPFPRGRTLQCAQSNMGVWSHNPWTSQIYAYDWGHDQGDEVLAMRSGFASTYLDVLPDHTELEANVLGIEHRDIDEGPIPNPEHDRSWMPTPLISTARYVHGKHYGVRHALAALGVPPSMIVNHHIRQGRFAFFSGDTGRSFYNHLHAHVGVAGAQTIPFIFRDSSEDNGRLKDLTWYESENDRLPNIANISPICPPEQASHILASNVQMERQNGRTMLINFDGRAADIGAWVSREKEGMFNGCVLILSSPGGADMGQEIEKYAWDTDAALGRITLKADWPGGTIAEDTVVSIQSRARETTASTIKLDGFADYTRDDYSGATIYVWWLDATGKTVVQQKRITAYNTETRLATIDGTWDIQPPIYANFEIGQRPFAQANDFKKRFAYVAADNPAVGTSPRYPIAQIAYGNAPGNIGRPSAPAAATVNTLILGLNAPTDVTRVENHFIAISSSNASFIGGNILVYRRITSYNPGTREITVDSNWGIPITTNRVYAIGLNTYANKTPFDVTMGAFICDDTTPNQYTPTNFSDGRTPYLIRTY